MTEDIDMGGHDILNVEVQDPNPADLSAINVKWVKDRFASTNGFSMIGNINMGKNQMT